MNEQKEAKHMFVTRSKSGKPEYHKLKQSKDVIMRWEGIAVRYSG